LIWRCGEWIALTLRRSILNLGASGVVPWLTGSDWESASTWPSEATDGDANTAEQPPAQPSQKAGAPFAALWEMSISWLRRMSQVRRRDGGKFLRNRLVSYHVSGPARHRNRRQQTAISRAKNAKPSFQKRLSRPPPGFFGKQKIFPRTRTVFQMCGILGIRIRFFRVYIKNGERKTSTLRGVTKRFVPQTASRS